jgi:LysM repeat protein
MIHRVKSGDTLNEIAQKYGISEDKIIAQNSIENGVLVKDTVIVIP